MMLNVVQTCETQYIVHGRGEEQTAGDGSSPPQWSRNTMNTRKEPPVADGSTTESILRFLYPQPWQHS
jgi:hypothetical protein